MAKLKKALTEPTTVEYLKDALKPEFYDHFRAVINMIAGFKNNNLTFKVPCLALNMGTQLKYAIL